MESQSYRIGIAGPIRLVYTRFERRRGQLQFDIADFDAATAFRGNGIKSVPLDNFTTTNLVIVL